MNSVWEVIGAWGRFMGVGISPTTVERITDFAVALMGLAIFASAVLQVKRGTVWTGLVATGMAAVSVRYYRNSSLPGSVDHGGIQVPNLDYRDHGTSGIRKSLCLLPPRHPPSARTRLRGHAA